MKIDQIRLHNFRIYRGTNEISFSSNEGKNITLIAGKNGFGKTTFLTSLIWTLYGNLMSQVEEKYRRDIRTAGGYEDYLLTLLNNQVRREFEQKKIKSATLLAEVQLSDVLIPSIPCKNLTIRRYYDYGTNKETLKILIDGDENELTKEVGYETFINDFILPREIAKFFFFDAEKIVSLAEAKSKAELRSLSKAYSEVLGIKKYEDLKANLTALQTKLRRSGAKEVSKEKLQALINRENEIQKLLNYNQDKQKELSREIGDLKIKIDQLQEKLIREGNEISLEDLKALKKQKADLKKEIEEVKQEMKQYYELLPFLMAPKAFKDLVDQLKTEQKILAQKGDSEYLKQELKAVEKELLSGLKTEKVKAVELKKVKHILSTVLEKRLSQKKVKGEVLLGYSDDQIRNILSTYEYVNGPFKSAFEITQKKEKDLRLQYTRLTNKIKQSEARKGNPLAQKIREEKVEADNKLLELEKKKEEINIEVGKLQHEYSSNNRVLSEYEKNFKLVANDQKKYEVTEKLLAKVNRLIENIKEEKKYSLQKAVQVGLNKLMHKKTFVSKVEVEIDDDVMDLHLIGKDGNYIDKDSLSKGEQQLYATALLKALVDESGINFPVFIDSPLQKFDKHHSTNVIQQFYPSISDQVVLFPLLEKELSEKEYKLLKPNLNDTFLIQNTEEGSSFKACKIDQLFKTFNEQEHVYAH